MTASTGEFGCCRRSTLKSTCLIRTQNALPLPTCTPFSLLPLSLECLLYSYIGLPSSGLLSSQIYPMLFFTHGFGSGWYFSSWLQIPLAVWSTLIDIDIVMSVVINRVIISGRGKQWQIASFKTATAIIPGPCALPESCPFSTKKQEVESISPFIETEHTFVTTPRNRRLWKFSAWLPG